MPLIEFINVEWIYSKNKLKEFRERELRKPELSERSISMFMLLRKKIKVTLPAVLAASFNLF